MGWTKFVYGPKSVFTGNDLRLVTSTVRWWHVYSSRFLFQLSHNLNFRTILNLCSQGSEMFKQAYLMTRMFRSTSMVSDAKQDEKQSNKRKQLIFSHVILVLWEKRWNFSAIFLKFYPTSTIMVFNSVTEVMKQWIYPTSSAMHARLIKVNCLQKGKFFNCILVSISSLGLIITEFQ